MRNVINAGCADTARLVDMAEGSPERVPHGLLPEEREAIIALSKDETHADLSHRQLAVVASEHGKVEAGASSFYRVMKKEGLMKDRERRLKMSQIKPEVKPDLRRSGVGLNVYTSGTHICVSIRHN